MCDRYLVVCTDDPLGLYWCVFDRDTESIASARYANEYMAITKCDRLNDIENECDRLNGIENAKRIMMGVSS